MRLVPAVLCASVLAGCLDPQTVPSGQVNAAPPVNYRQTVAEYVRTAWVDPYSIRDAAISQPFPIRYGLMGQDTVWFVCVRDNARNRLGGYTGLTETPIAFTGNAIDRNRSDIVRTEMGGRTMCKPAVYEPFPEIEGKA
jgi:hypothetical protein